MTFDDYSKQALTTAIYKTAQDQMICSALGLVGESGEVAEKIKKIIRDKDYFWDANDRTEIGKELGDVLWYINSLADSFSLYLNDIATTNLEKLKSRQKRNKIKGSGDNR